MKKKEKLKQSINLQSIENNVNAVAAVIAVNYRTIMEPSPTPLGKYYIGAKTYANNKHVDYDVKTTGLSQHGDVVDGAYLLDIQKIDWYNH